MIQNKKDLKFYLEEDRKAYNKPKKRGLKDLFFKDRFYEYMKVLRKLEYCQNTNKLRRFYYAIKLGKLKQKTGIDLDTNVAGPGLQINHGKIVVGCYSKIGANCKILSDVTIGIANLTDDRHLAPKIGDNVIIGTGARILGNIVVADNVVIGANAVVTKSIEEKGAIVVGIPAKIIGNIFNKKEGE